ncbi:MAG TPA: hypothetical protein VNH83_04775 [Bryobacteraceae bacterium]|nr:hypothetical protein [Bryobacteraceae bacterium]
MSGWDSALDGPPGDAAPRAGFAIPNRTRAAAVAIGVLFGGAASAFIGWAYWTALNAPAVGMFHDDGIYLVTAKALATGHGYRIISLPGEIAQTKYPILFPALLAAVWKMSPQFPQNLFWLKLAPLACTLVWGALAFQFFRHETGSMPVAIALTGWLAMAPWVLFLGTALLSETLFAALVTGALLLVRRLERGDGGWPAVAGMALLASGAFLTRTLGITLLVAAGMMLCRRHRWRQAAIFAMLCSTLCGPWIWWQARQHSAALAHAAYYSSANYGNWNILLHYAPGEKARILSQNLMGALLAPATLVGVPATGAGPLLALALGALIVAGFAVSFRGRWAALEIFVLLYGAGVLSWAWPPVRFVAPLLPVLLLYAYRGAQAACRLVSLRARQTVVAMVCLAVPLLLQGAWSLRRTAVAIGDGGTVEMPGLPQDDWREMARMLDWIGRNAPPDAVLIGNLDPVLYLYTGRKSVRAFIPNPYLLHYATGAGVSPLGTPGELLDIIRWYRANYLVCSPNASFREGPYLARLTNELMREHPERFGLVYRSADSRYRIYATVLDAYEGDLSVKPNFGAGSRLIGSN